MRTTAKVRERLAEERQAGQDFAAAWPAVLGTLEPDEREEWWETLEATAGAWQSAYRGEPATRAQWAFSAIGEDPEREEAIDLPDVWQRICESCGGAIPAERQSNARFCSRACQRAIHRRQVAA